MASQDFTTPGLTSWQAPAGVTSVTVRCWGSGAGGTAGGEFDSGSGGEGGGFAEKIVAVTPLASYDVFVGTGDTAGAQLGESSYFGAGPSVRGKGGNSGDTSIGDTINAGGTGAGGAGGVGGGGGGAGGIGGAGTNASGQNNGLGGDAPAGNGGNGGNSGGNGENGQLYGGGGGGGGDTFGSYGNGADGRVYLEWTVGGSSNKAALRYKHRYRY